MYTFINYKQFKKEILENEPDLLESNIQALFCYVLYNENEMGEPSYMNARTLRAQLIAFDQMGMYDLKTVKKLGIPGETVNVEKDLKTVIEKAVTKKNFFKDFKANKYGATFTDNEIETIYKYLMYEERESNELQEIGIDGLIPSFRSFKSLEVAQAALLMGKDEILRSNEIIYARDSIILLDLCQF